MKGRLPVIILLLCAAAFALGVVQLFRLRFAAGDVYPPYSSLRADPLGTMAFYESLGKLPRISVSRDYSAANRLPEGKDTAYLHLAASTYQWRRLPEDTFKEIDAFLAHGGRLVITFFPEAFDYRSFYRGRDRKEPEPTGEQPAKDDKRQDGRKSGPSKPAEKKARERDAGDFGLGSKMISLKDRWGVEFRVVNLSQNEKGVYEPASVVNQSDLPLPRTLAWHSGVVFTNLDDAWQPIYARGNRAVVIERRFGHGTVVMATDSYFVSNEALQKERHADLLAWLVGPGRTIIFDEAHLGVVARSGVAMLMRQYRLHWFAGGLLLLAALFIWKNSVSLVPPHADEAAQEFIAGKDAAAGFVNLLRRNIPARDLLRTCFAEWKKSAAQAGKYSANKLQQAEAIFQVEQSLPVRERDPIATYRAISAVLETRPPAGPTIPDSRNVKRDA